MPPASQGLDVWEMQFNNAKKLKLWKCLKLWKLWKCWALLPEVDSLLKLNENIEKESKNQLWALLPEVDSLVKLNENIEKESKNQLWGGLAGRLARFGWNLAGWHGSAGLAWNLAGWSGSAGAAWSLAGWPGLWLARLVWLACCP